MNTLIWRVWCLLALHLVVPAIAADGIQIVKEPTGKAVQAAIDACAAQGGGVAYLPPGRYVSGPLWLKDNVELRLEAGATVVLSPDKKDWPTGEPALVNAKGAKHIAITGRGTFDGNAQWEYRPVSGADPEIKWEQENAQRAGVEMKRYYRTGEVQKRLFLLHDCEDVRLEGVTIRERAALECPSAGLQPRLDSRHLPVFRSGARRELGRDRHRLLLERADLRLDHLHGRRRHLPQDLRLGTGAARNACVPRRTSPSTTAFSPRHRRR